MRTESSLPLDAGGSDGWAGGGEGPDWEMVRVRNIMFNDCNEGEYC